MPTTACSFTSGLVEASEWSSRRAPWKNMWYWSYEVPGHHPSARRTSRSRKRCIWHTRWRSAEAFFLATTATCSLNRGCWVQGDPQTTHLKWGSATTRRKCTLLGTKEHTWDELPFFLCPMLNPEMLQIIWFVVCGYQRERKRMHIFTHTYYDTMSNYCFKHINITVVAVSREFVVTAGCLKGAS